MDDDVPLSERSGPVPVITDLKKVAGMVQTLLHTKIGNIQLQRPSFSKYTDHQIRCAWLEAHAGLELPFTPPRYCMMPFTPEEDYQLLQLIRKNVELVPKSIAAANLCPLRHMETVLDRINQIKEMTKEQQSLIVRKLAEQYFLEEIQNQPEHWRSVEARELRSLTSPPSYTTPDFIDNEIKELIPTVSTLTFTDLMGKPVLGLLRNKRVQFQITQISVIIGRGSSANKVDIDLSFIIPPGRSHISRKQAVITLMTDYNFYIQNIGKRPIRVNGVYIPPEGMCVLSTFSLIDFSGLLLLFIPNTELIGRASKG